MFNKKIMLIAMILVGLLAITAVSAAENTTQDIAVIDEDIEENLDISHDEILKESSTIADLNTTINDNTASEINLTADYAYTDSDSVFENGIEINRDLTINGNGHQIDGGDEIRLFHVTAGTVVFKNLTFLNGHTDNEGYGAAIWTENAHVTAMDCTFNNCTATYGGAMVGGNAINCTFNSNQGENGGAMYNSHAINCTFNSNQGENGGAMYNSHAINCTFISNFADENGGAIYWESEDGKISYCVFLNNFAGESGGAIFCGDYIKADYCWFGNNAINYNKPLPIVQTNCDYRLFLNATAKPDTISYSETSDIIFKLYLYDSKTGHITEYDNTPFKNIDLTITATNGNVSKKTAKLEESIQFTPARTGPTTVTATVENAAQTIEIQLKGDFDVLQDLVNNESVSVINLERDYTYNGHDRITEGVRINRTITINGNGYTIDAKGKSRIFLVEANNVTIKNITFINGKVMEGGAIFWNGGSGSVYNCTFINNTALRYGGAVCQKGDDGKLYNCIFINNSGVVDGAVSWYGNDGNIHNCLFINNTASVTGAIRIVNGKTSIYNCSFIKNTAETFGIIFLSGGGDISIYKCIFMENSVDDMIIHIYKSTNNTINNNIFLDNGAKEIDGINETDTTSNTNYNWYGNNATNYANNPNLTKCNIWLFLDGKSNTDYIGINDTCDITFKLYAYNSTSQEIIEYDNSLLKPLYLTVKSTDGHIDKNTVKLGESIKYTETTNETVKVTAQIRSASQSVEIFFCKKEVDLSFDNQTVDYSENTIITIDYNRIATGTLNMTLKGKKYNHTYKDVKLNTTIPLGNILPDEYYVTIKYSGDDYFFNATTYGELIIRKLNPNLQAAGYDINVTDTKGVMFKVTLDKNATGTLRLENGTTITLEKGIGKIEIFNNAYPVGEYTWTFTYSGDDIYKNSTIQATSNILSIPTEIIPTDKTIELDFGDESKVNYTTKPNGLEGITFESTNPNVITVDADGTIKAVGAGSAEIILKYAGNATYAPSNATVTITVRKVDSTLTVNDIAFDYGGTGSTTVTYTGATGIKASINDSSALVEINGKTITVSNLNVGNYTITVTTIPDANHNNITKTANITVSKVDSTLTVTDIAFDYDGTGSTTVTYTGATGFTAEILNQPKATVSISGNTITVSGLDIGSYTLSVTTIADANHNKVTKTATITVNKLKTELSANAVTTTYGTNKNLIISLKNTAGKPVSGVQITVRLNGAKTYTTDSNGQVTIKTGNLVPKTYTVKITFKGNTKYDASAKEVKVTVKKAKSKITAKKKTFKKAKKIKKYTITLKANKKPIKKVWVTLKIKGKKTIKAKTNNKGKATFKIKKLTKKGKYKATIKFKGNKYYLKATKKTKITIR